MPQRWTYLQRARVFDSRADDALAIEQLRAALALDPEHETARRALQHAEARIRRWRLR